MQAIAERPQQLERQKSFNIVANVDMMRNDIGAFGHVLPETYFRVMDERNSFLAEGIDKASCTTFVLHRNPDGDMRYFDRGEWRPYSDMLYRGLRVATEEAEADPRRQFLKDWAVENLIQGSRMRSLKPGEQFVWRSSYPYDAEEVYGKPFIQQCGLQPDRQMGFIYLARAREDGAIELQSQTVDRSNDKAFAAVLSRANRDPAVDMDGLRDEYDHVLSREHHGEKFYAGRLDAEIHENAYLEVLTNQDLIQYDMERLEAIARAEVSDQTREHMTKRHTYGVWALFKKRIEGLADTSELPLSSYADRQNLAVQVEYAFREFAVARKVMAACGGALEAEQDQLSILNASVEEVFSQIFHNATELFTSVIGKEFYTYNELHFCDECQAPPSDGDKKKWCGPCGLCEPCDDRLRVVGAAV